MPTVVFHDAYLVGIVAMFCGLSLRCRARARLVAGGAAVAIGAVFAQLAVAPL
jgi:hypothetical protein